jgi:hypothetical protein
MSLPLRSTRTAWSLSLVGASLVGASLAGCDCSGMMMGEPDASGTDAAIPPGVDGGPLPDGFVPPDAPLPVATNAVIEIHALDLWAQPLPASARLSVTRDGASVPTTGTWPIVAFPVIEAATYEVTLTAEGHHDLDFAITYDGSTDLDAITVRRGTGTERAGLLTSHDVRSTMGRTLPVHAVFTGLRHRWFSAQGRPARRGNHVRLMTSGEEAWGQVAEDLLMATDRVHAATWWWDSTFELVRDASTHVTSTRGDRQANTILGILDDSFPDKRVLVGQLVEPGRQLSRGSRRCRGSARAGRRGRRWLRVHGRGQRDERDVHVRGSTLLVRGARARAGGPTSAGRAFDDGVAPITSTVPSPPGRSDRVARDASTSTTARRTTRSSWSIDGEVAFMGGMNLRPVDWDTDAHLVFEPRRMAHRCDSTSRPHGGRHAHDALPDTGPARTT